MVIRILEYLRKKVEMNCKLTQLHILKNSKIPSVYKLIIRNKNKILKIVSGQAVAIRYKYSIKNSSLYDYN